MRGDNYNRAFPAESPDSEVSAVHLVVPGRSGSATFFAYGRHNGEVSAEISTTSRSRRPAKYHAVELSEADMRRLHDWLEWHLHGGLVAPSAETLEGAP